MLTPLGSPGRRDVGYPLSPPWRAAGVAARRIPGVRRLDEWRAYLRSSRPNAAEWESCVRRIAIERMLSYTAPLGHRNSSAHVRGRLDAMQAGGQAGFLEKLIAREDDKSQRGDASSPRCREPLGERSRNLPHGVSVLNGSATMIFPGVSPGITVRKRVQPAFPREKTRYGVAAEDGKMVRGPDVPGKLPSCGPGNRSTGYVASEL